MEKSEDNVKVFEKMYNELVLPCCELIEKSKFHEAYIRYKNYTMKLVEKYL